MKSVEFILFCIMMSTLIFLFPRLFHLIIPLLSHLKLPDDIERQKSILSFYDDRELCTFLLEFMKDFLFLPYRCVTSYF